MELPIAWAAKPGLEAVLHGLTVVTFGGEPLVPGAFVLLAMDCAFRIPPRLVLPALLAMEAALIPCRIAPASIKVARKIVIVRMENALMANARLVARFSPVVSLDKRVVAVRTRIALKVSARLAEPVSNLVNRLASARMELLVRHRVARNNTAL